MTRRGRGYVINVASAAGLLAPPNMAPYNVTKAAVVALSETLQAELNSTGVHVTVLCPTFFQTQIAANARGPNAGDQRAIIEKLMRRSRVQAPDVARTALSCVDRGELYALPMRDGRWFWRLKRAAPHSYFKLAAYAVRRAGQK